MLDQDHSGKAVDLAAASAAVAVAAASVAVLLLRAQHLVQAAAEEVVVL